MKNKLFLYAYALFTLKPSQLLYYIIRRGIPDVRNYTLSEPVTVNTDLKPAHFVQYSMNADSPHELRFLNRSRRLDSKKPDWACDDMPRLWRYNLHYFDFLHDPEFDPVSKDLLIQDWITNNPIGTVTAWEPYTLSLRLVNWIKYLQYEDVSKLNPLVVQSLAQQAHWLSKNLEKHILANHYFKNIKALIFAGTFLEGKGPDLWLKHGIRELQIEVAEQSCDDGGHYERSPMYHSIYLEDLLDIIQLLSASGIDAEFPVDLRKKALAAALFLRDLRMPNGQFPLFNDAAFGIAPEPDVLLHYAHEVLAENLMDQTAYPQTTAFSSSGFYILGDTQNRMILDCGETGPRYQPGHTHCDTLSYELAVNSLPVIVDSGTHDYEPGNRRQFNRSTQAHNTVVVDKTEQSEIWGLFRVARRASPIFARYKTVDSGATFSGAHNGYKRLKNPVIHQRDVEFELSRGWSVTDRFDGSGTHLLESYIHLHPDIDVKRLGNRLILSNQVQDSLVEIVVSDGGDIEIIDSVYHPQFGIEIKNQTILMSYHCQLPAQIGYDINRL